MSASSASLSFVIGLALLALVKAIPPPSAARPAPLPCDRANPDIRWL